MSIGKVRLCLVVFFAIFSGCADSPQRPPPKPLSPEVALRLALVQRLKDFEAEHGYAPTKHFLQYEENAARYAYCGKAEKLAFGTEWKRVQKEEECSLAGDRHDARFDEVEAVDDMNGAPLSPAMVSAKLERFVMVVLHEDFHAQQTGLPSVEVNESAAQLVGFILAKKFFINNGEEFASAAKAMDNEAAAFLAPARLLVAYHARLENLYAMAASGKVTREDALRARDKLFLELELDCAKFTVLPKTASACAGIKNNIDLERVIPYARHYELFYDLYLACGKDARSTTAFFLRLSRAYLTEVEYLTSVRAAMTAGPLQCR
jgi:hypothetical protein